jgi:D-xylose transport system permease protein
MLPPLGSMAATLQNMWINFFALSYNLKKQEVILFDFVWRNPMETLSSNTNAPDRAPGGIRRALAQRDLGLLPVLLGLALIAAIFQAANPNFLTPRNLTNLLVQIAAVGTIAVGVVLVLLIGEIDLSVGAVSGLCAAVMAVLSVKHGVPAPLAIGAGVLAGAGIGVLQGAWIARLRVPSFVVTLAGLLGWQGVLLYVLGDTGTINLTDPLITGVANARLPVALGWLAGIVAIGAYSFSVLRERQQRIRAGLAVDPLALAAGRIAILAIGVLAAIGLMSVDRNPSGAAPVRGIPAAVLCFVGCIVVFDLITRRTRFGRYIFAVGANAEAARRAGISVERVRVAVFALSSALAACGGILAGSRLFAVNQSSGGGDILLDVIAAAVIGGTSLFGGRGRVWSALPGALVIGAIANGMDLLALSSSIKFMVTGAVLLVAVTIDAYTRSRRELY